jgi:hypothetical protein
MISSRDPRAIAGGAPVTTLASATPRGVVMASSIRGLLTLGVAPIMALAACASSPPPAVRAAQAERLTCDAADVPSRAESLVQSARVLRVEPLYSHVPTANNDFENRVNGAEILIRPIPGVTPDQLAGILRCRNVRLLLGQVTTALSSDPYWLPDSWVNIEVKAEGGNDLITVSADSIRESLEVLGRAKRYRDDRAVAVDPGLP